jgi:basic membrane lipoprotein Med (substrate-binding protein (PBP1-ABC) superfamily)
VARDKGRDFDNQWNASNAAGRRKAARGEGPWVDDAYLRRINNERQADRNAAQQRQNSESYGKATVILLSLLGGVAWGVSEVVSRLA